MGLDDDRHTVTPELRGETIGGGTDGDGVNGGADGAGEGDRLQGGRGKHAPVVFGDDEHGHRRSPNSSRRSTMAGTACTPVPSMIV